MGTSTKATTKKRAARTKKEIIVLSTSAKPGGMFLEGEEYTADEAALLDEVQAKYRLPLWEIGKILRDVQAQQASGLLSLNPQIQELKLEYGEETIEAVKIMIVARLGGANATAPREAVR